MNKILAIVVMVLLLVFILCYPAVMREVLVSKIKHSYRMIRSKM